MNSGGFGAGMCRDCGGSLLPIEGIICFGCRPDKPDTLKAKDRVLTEKQRIEVIATRDNVVVDLPF